MQKFSVAKAREIENHYKFYEEDIWNDPTSKGFKLNLRPPNAGFYIIAAMNVVVWTGMGIAIIMRSMH